MMTSTTTKPTLPAIRALARQEGSELLRHVPDAALDKAIQKDIDRPAATPLLPAAAAINSTEFDVLVQKLREAVADGSVPAALHCRSRTRNFIQVGWLRG